jgi:hypothetical protein
VNYKLKKSHLLVLLLLTACEKSTTNIKDRIPKYEITSMCYDTAAKVYNVDVLYSNCKNSDTQVCVYTVRGIGVDSVIALGINGIHHVQLAANSLDTGGVSVYVKNADTLYPSKTRIPAGETCD